eukprot:scaffold2115_cov97-Cylindrotheca_fusiformis.AAC.5
MDHFNGIMLSSIRNTAGRVALGSWFNLIFYWENGNSIVLFASRRVPKALKACPTAIRAHLHPNLYLFQHFLFGI